MSQENAQRLPSSEAFDEWVRVCSEFWHAFNRRDFQAALRFVQPDCEVQDHPDFPDAEWHYGHVGAGQWAAKVLGTWPDLQIRPVDFIPVDDSRLIVPVVASGSGKHSGIPLSEELAAVVTMRDGKGVRVELYHSTGEALEAVGLSE